MNPNYTHISILLDRSGSMGNIKDDVIGGFNDFLAEQKKLPDQLTLTLAQFDNQYETLYINRNVQEVSPMTNESFQPRGSTALLDSAVRLINETGAKLASMSESERPGKVLFTIITDGFENASVEQTKETLAAAIKHQEEKYGWQFIYLGANQDSFTEGSSMGLRGVNFQATSVGTGKLFKGYSGQAAKYRSAAVGSLFSLSQDDIDNA